jgi:hypothetical protein
VPESRIETAVAANSSFIVYWKQEASSYGLKIQIDIKSNLQKLTKKN